MSASSGNDGLIARKQAVAKIDSSTQVFKAAARGWRLFPVKAHAKEAFLKGWPEEATCGTSKLATWLREYPKCNWAVALGPESGVFVIDTDTDEAIERFSKMGPVPRTFTVKTSRGKHFYFQYPQNLTIRNSKSLGEKIDVKSDRGYVLFPPSIHPSGAVYEIIDDCDPALAPDWLLKRLTNPKPESRATTAQVEQAENSTELLRAAATRL